MESSIEQCRYALAKQVLDMAHSFTIHTGCGDIEIASEEARPFVAITAALLRKRLSTARKHALSFRVGART